MTRFKGILPVLLVLGLLEGLVGWATPASAGSDGQPKGERLIVYFRQGASAYETSRLHHMAGARVKAEIAQINAHVVVVPPGRAGSYRAHGSVLSVETDPEVTVEELPNDPGFAQQWGLSNVQAQQAWDITQGNRNIIIAIVDTGIDLEHVDLAAKIVASRNFTKSPTADDIHGHGTHVAGIAAAIAGNGLGVAGLGYNSSLMNVKVLSDTGGGYHSDIAQGVVWAVDNGANVINMSLGSGVSSTVLQQAIDYAWSKGAVVVAAAGNSGDSAPSYPAYYAKSIAVAATDRYDKRYSFSNYGAWVDVAAPGSAYTTLPGNNYGNRTGTSMASPFVAGLAGLAFALATDRNGNGFKNDEVRAMIESGADNIGSLGISGGRVNAYRTVSGSAVPLPSPPDVGGENRLLPDAHGGLGQDEGLQSPGGGGSRLNR